MSKEKTLRTSEETEVMQATGVPAQETEEVSAALATEIIADSQKTAWKRQKKRRKDWEESWKYEPRSGQSTVQTVRHY